MVCIILRNRPFSFDSFVSSWGFTNSILVDHFVGPPYTAILNAVIHPQFAADRRLFFNSGFLGLFVQFMFDFDPSKTNPVSSLPGYREPKYKIRGCLVLKLNIFPPHPIPTWRWVQAEGGRSNLKITRSRVTQSVLATGAILLA